MVIQNENDASMAIRAVADWLAAKSLKAPAKSSIDPHRWGTESLEPEIADVAREFCKALLEAARADGDGGCELCKA